jgi:hypothetical protein
MLGLVSLPSVSSIMLSCQLLCKDLITWTLAVLLIATFIAFFSGFLPYPFGWLILVVLLLGRFAYVAADKKICLIQIGNCYCRLPAPVWPRVSN